MQMGSSPVFAATAWWDTSWSYRVPVTITENSGTTLTNYQVKIEVDHDSNMKPNFSDIRFVYDNEQLDYWLESFVSHSSAIFWVKVPELTADVDVTIEMYYGNSSASSESDIHDTFIWGDDFEDKSWTWDNVNPYNWEHNIPDPDNRSTQAVIDGAYDLQGPLTGYPDNASNNLARPVAEIIEGGDFKVFPDTYVAEAKVKKTAEYAQAIISPRYYTNYDFNDNRYEATLKLIPTVMGAWLYFWIKWITI
jgi:hypothetical protein